MKLLYSQPAVGDIRVLQLPSPQMFDCSICGAVTAEKEIPLIDNNAVCLGCASEYQQVKGNDDDK